MYQQQSKPAKTDPSLETKIPKLPIGQLFPDDEESQKTLSHLKRRFETMESSRPDNDWDIRMKQFQALTHWKADGTANTNLPIEQATIRNKMADSLAQSPIFNFIPVEKDDIDKVSVTKELWQFTWHEAGTDEELFDLYMSSYIFGLGWWFEGVHRELRTEFIPKIGKDGLITGEAKQTELSWIKGRALDIRDVYIDPVHNIDLAVDCFILERNIDRDTLENLKNDPNFDSDAIDLALQSGQSTDNKERSTFTTQEEQYTSDEKKDKFTFYHYYHKTKGIYVVAVDNKNIIRNGITPYAHGELPISALVDHKNPFQLYGRGECELLEGNKYERNTQRNMMIDRSRRSNDVKLALGGGLSLEDQGFIDSVTQVLKFDGDLTQMQHLKPPSPDSSLFKVEELFKADATWITGIDNDALIGGTTKTAFEARLQEQTKLKGINVSLKLASFFYRRMARQRLANIQMWFPITTGKKILGTSKFRTISLPDKKLKDIKRVIKGTTDTETSGVNVIDKEGETALLEIKPSLIRSNIDVQVETPSTTSVLKELNSIELQELLRMVIEVAQIKPDIIEEFDFKKILSDRINNLGRSAQDFMLKKGEQASIQDTREEVLQDLPQPFKPKMQPQAQKVPGLVPQEQVPIKP